MKLVLLLSLGMLVRCGNSSQPTKFDGGSGQGRADAAVNAPANDLTASRDELLDPQGKWSESKHAHIGILPTQFSKWKQVDPEVHTWCVNFKDALCEEIYPDGDFDSTIRKKVDRACAATTLQDSWSWPQSDNCQGNFIEYSELEEAKPVWIKGKRNRATHYKYTAEGRWECPAGFDQGGESWAINGEPQVYYVPPAPTCRRTYYWGIWRRSPYAIENKS